MSKNATNNETALKQALEDAADALEKLLKTSAAPGQNGLREAEQHALAILAASRSTLGIYEDSQLEPTRRAIREGFRDGFAPLGKFAEGILEEQDLIRRISRKLQERKRKRESTGVEPTVIELEAELDRAKEERDIAERRWYMALDRMGQEIRDGLWTDEKQRELVAITKRIRETTSLYETARERFLAARSGAAKSDASEQQSTVAKSATVPDAERAPSDAARQSAPDAKSTEGRISEETYFAQDMARLDAEKPGWDHDGKVAGAESALQMGAALEYVQSIYGAEIAAEARRNVERTGRAPCDSALKTIHMHLNDHELNDPKERDRVLIDRLAFVLDINREQLVSAAVSFYADLWNGRNSGI